MTVRCPSECIGLCLTLVIFLSKKIAGRFIIKNEYRRIIIAGANYISHYVFNHGFVRTMTKAKEKMPR